MRKFCVASFTNMSPTDWCTKSIDASVDVKVLLMKQPPFYHQHRWHSPKKKILEIGQA